MDTSVDEIVLRLCEQHDEKTTYERLVCVLLLFKDILWKYVVMELFSVM